MVVATPLTSSSVSVNQARFRFCSCLRNFPDEIADKFRAAIVATAPGCENRRCKARARRAIGAIPLNACMLSTMFPLRICWMNFSKRRKASCSQTRFAIRNVRRSGSVTPSISRARICLHFRLGEMSSRALSKAKRWPAWPARKFFPTSRLARRTSLFRAA